MIDRAAPWVEGLVDRVGCYGLGSWLTEFGRWIGAPPPFPPVRSARFFICRNKGIEVELHDPGWQTRTAVSTDDWVLYDVTFDGSLDALPFHLSPADTPELASRKLSRDIVRGDRHPDGTQTISYFLPDLRVVALTFKPQFAGLESVKLARLYDWSDWRRAALPADRGP